jgi:hypothetical protein
MKVRIGEPPPEAAAVLAAPEPDASDVGINHADAYLKVFRQTLADGRKLACKRRGLELTLSLGERKGTALLRRLEHGPDVREILHQALVEAARDLGGELTLEDGALYLETGD